jgi:hypothetical protein
LPGRPGDTCGPEPDEGSARARRDRNRAGGKTKLSLKAEVPSGVVGSSFLDSITGRLQSSTNVTIQVRAQDAGCFTSTLTDIVKQEDDIFKAK